jgi:hypothetical protein
MQWISRIGLALCLGVLLSLLTPQSAQAQLCFSNTDCSAGLVCRQGYLGVNWCRNRACNSDRDCPRAQRPCTLGECTPLSTGGGSSSGGTSGSGGGGVAGVGQRCGKVQMGGGVVKNVGCRRPLQCQNGRCQQPQT